MFVLKHHDPTRCQIHQEWRTVDEVTRVKPGGYVVCKSPHLAKKLQTKGFKGLIDDNDVLIAGSPGVTKSEASEILNVPVPVVNKWIDAGKLRVFSIGSHEPVMVREEVEELARQRGA